MPSLGVKPIVGRTFLPSDDTERANVVVLSEPFWRATKDHKLMLQRCANGHVFYYARTHCPECLSRDTEWFEASGRGRRV
mgnify:CR=1 FL=1